MLYESLTPDTIKVVDNRGNEVAGTLSAQWGIVNFAPEQPLKANSQYKVIVRAGGVRDYAGNAVESTFESTFTTGSNPGTSLTHHWPLKQDTFDGAGDIHGTLTGGELLPTGGISLQERGEFLTLERDIGDLLGNNVSLAFYLSTAQTGSAYAWEAPGVTGRDQTGGTDDVFWGWLDDQSRLRLTAGNSYGIASPSPVNDGVMRHFVLTRNAETGELAMYQDGQLISSGSGTPGIFSGTSVTKLGTVDQNPVNLQGVLQDIRLYNKVLSASEISQLYLSLNDGIEEVTLEARQEVGEEAIFQATPLGGDATYQWHFGDGSSSALPSSPEASHIYQEPGHYQVILVVVSNGIRRTYSFIRTVSYPVTEIPPVASSRITGSGELVYNVNPDNGTVTAIHRQGMHKAWETHVGQAPGTLAVDNQGRVWVSVQEEDRLVALDSQGLVQKYIQLDYGSAPFGIAFIPETNTGLVTLQGKGEVLQFDGITGEVLKRAPVNAEPRGIAISGDGSSAYITRYAQRMKGR